MIVAKNGYHDNILYDSLKYFFVILLVLQCNSVYMVSSKFIIVRLLVNNLWQVIVFMLFIYSLVNYTDNCHTTRLFIYLFSCMSVLFIFIIYNFIINPNFDKSFIKILVDPIMLVTFFYYLHDIKRVNSLFICFNRIMLYISSFSLIFWLAFIMKIPTNTSIFTDKWGSAYPDPGYFYIDFFTGIANQSNNKFLGMNWIRNSGFFAEPSMLAYVIVIALLIELFIKHNNKVLNIHVYIFIITIITTASATGILVSFIAVFYSLLINSNKSVIFKLCIISIIPLLFIFLKLVILNKTQNMNLGSSYSVRTDDIIAGFSTWLRHPILGCGINNISAIRTNMSSWRFIATVTNPTSLPYESSGFFTILAQGGILLGLFYLLPTIMFSHISFRSFGLALFSFIPFIFVVAQGFYIYIMLLSYFWFVIIVKNKVPLIS